MLCTPRQLDHAVPVGRLGIVGVVHTPHGRRTVHITYGNVWGALTPFMTHPHNNGSDFR